MCCTHTTVVTSTNAQGTWSNRKGRQPRERETRQPALLGGHCSNIHFNPILRCCQFSSDSALYCFPTMPAAMEWGERVEFSLWGWGGTQKKKKITVK